MSAHDRYQEALSPRRDVRIAHPPVRMPRQQRPLYIGDAGFWPRAEQVPLCWFLALVIVAEVATLAWAIWHRR